jgi:hypothetical protein
MEFLRARLNGTLNLGLPIATHVPALFSTECDITVGPETLNGQVHPGYIIPFTAPKEFDYNAIKQELGEVDMPKKAQYNVFGIVKVDFE